MTLFPWISCPMREERKTWRNSENYTPQKIRYTYMYIVYLSRGNDTRERESSRGIILFNFFVAESDTGQDCFFSLPPRKIHRMSIPSDKLCVRFALHVERTTARGCNVSLLQTIRRHLNWNFNFKLKHKSIVTSGKNLALSLLLFSEAADFSPRENVQKSDTSIFIDWSRAFSLHASSHAEFCPGAVNNIKIHKLSTVRFNYLRVQFLVYREIDWRNNPGAHVTSWIVLPSPSPSIDILFGGKKNV